MSTPNHPSRRIVAATVGAVALLVSMPAASGQKFFADDPVWEERDTQDASRVQRRDVDLVYDTVENLFTSPGDKAPHQPAQNVNTVGEVPDSSWYVNRAGRIDLTTDDLLKGPDTTEGPAPGPWTVVSGKNEGITPGFTVRDTAGIFWFIKVDPPGYRGMATGTETVVTKLFWALGYHVSEVHVVQMHREDLVLAQDATITPPGGRKRRMRPGDIDRALKRAAHDADGTYRVLASRGIEGKAVGGFRFFGTRSDDPNDYVPHEHRRELRGYGTFAAWVNHVDSKSINTFDTLVTRDGRTFVRHYLLDFGSTIGSGGVHPRERFEGAEYLLEANETLKGIVSFGFAIDHWRTMPMYRASSVGAFPTDHRNWDPDRWKPRIPNAAFLGARADDKFWAARKLQALTPAMLREVVKVGRFGDEGSEGAVAHFLIERRHAILRKYLTAMNPVVNPELSSDGALTFANAAVDAGVANPPRDGYKMRWLSFDNASGASTLFGEVCANEPRGRMPAALSAAAATYVLIQLSAIDADHPVWGVPVHVYFVRQPHGWKLVGLERPGA